MVTLLVLFQLFIVLALIFIGARVGGIGLGMVVLAVCLTHVGVIHL